jgi:hypothetical protein
MQLVSKIFSVVIAVCLSTAATQISAQENSPYSRYGMGDIFPAGHALNRGMGGTGVAYADLKNINFANPASYSNLLYVTYDVGLMVDARVLKSANPEGSFKSTNFTPSYVNIGLPINGKKHIGGVVGFRPYSRVNYSIIENKRLTTPSPFTDSLQTLYEGNGGLNEFYFGVGKKWMRDSGRSVLSIGINAGYAFGRKENYTKINFVNDTIAYYKSNSGTTVNFRGVFAELGMQYQARLKEVDIPAKKLKETYSVRFGATVALNRNLKATQDLVRETFTYSSTGGTVTIDSVYGLKNQRGTIKIPATYTAGFMFMKTVGNTYYVADKWSIGAEYTTTNWTNYSYYNQPDKLTTAWQLRVGGSFAPDPIGNGGYWSKVTYRAGFYTGKDYINADGKELKIIAGTFGFGFPIRKQNYSNQFTVIHSSFEFGKRGSAVNNVTDGFFRVSLGLSLSDVWFIKRKYD